MSQTVDAARAAGRLCGAESVVILSHSAPDGDTIGAAYALGAALLRLGKRVQIRCSDPIPPKYDYLSGLLSGPKPVGPQSVGPRPAEKQPAGEQPGGSPPAGLDPDLVVAVDTADRKLLGKNVEPYAGRVGLCIDHHVSNTGYADELLLDTRAAATCEAMVPVLEAMGVPIDAGIADALYTGLISDTGCFRYANTTPDTLRCGARLADCGAHTSAIAKKLFETVSMARMKVEAAALATLRFYHGGRTAVMVVSYDAVRRAGAHDWELEGLPSLPIRVQGVLAGVTLKEKEPGRFKISVRTVDPVDAAAVCAKAGGGGHKNAAGCELPGPADAAREQMVALVGEALGA